MVSHNIAEDKGSCDIVVVVFDRLSYRLAYCLETCKVDNRVDVIFLKHLFHSSSVKKVCLVEFEILACKLLDYLHSSFLGVGEIIEDNDVLACIKKLNAGM